MYIKALITKKIAKNSIWTKLFKYSTYKRNDRLLMKQSTKKKNSDYIYNQRCQTETGGTFKSRNRTTLLFNQSGERKLDAKKITKNANFYFQNRPTCLKRINTESDESSESHKEVSNSKLDYNQRLLESDINNKVKPPKYSTNKIPYYEDREGYDLNACIQLRRKPNFGYPLPDLFEGINDERQGFDF